MAVGEVLQVVVTIADCSCSNYDAFILLLLHRILLMSIALAYCIYLSMLRYAQPHHWWTRLQKAVVKGCLPWVRRYSIHPSIYIHSFTHSFIMNIGLLTIHYCMSIHSFIHSFTDSGACCELVDWYKEEEFSEGHRPAAALILRPFHPLAVTAVCRPQLQAVTHATIAQLHALLIGSHERMWMDLPGRIELNWIAPSPPPHWCNHSIISIKTMTSYSIIIELDERPTLGDARMHVCLTGRDMCKRMHHIMQSVLSLARQA